MSNDITYMEIDEFREQGYLQEVNRLVLHPAGLALEVTSPWTRKDIEDWVAETNADHIESVGNIDPVAYLWSFIQAARMDKWHLSGVWDYRDDPEGMVYAKDQMSEEKRESVRAEWAKHKQAREEMLGGPDGADWPGRVQHVGEKPRVK